MKGEGAWRRQKAKGKRRAGKGGSKKKGMGAKGEGGEESDAIRQ